MDDEIGFKLAQLELRKAMEGLREYGGESQGPPYCSFYRTAKGHYRCLVEGNSDARICDRRVMDAYEIIQNEF